MGHIEELWKDILSIFHESPVQGHYVANATLQRIATLMCGSLLTIVLSHPYTENFMVRILWRGSSLMKLLASRLNIVSDRDSIFMSSFWKEMFKQLGVYCVGHHRIICKSKWLTIVGSGETKTTWAKWLALAKWQYNTTYHQTNKINFVRGIIWVSSSITRTIFCKGFKHRIIGPHASRQGGEYQVTEVTFKKRSKQDEAITQSEENGSELHHR